MVHTLGKENIYYTLKSKEKGVILYCFSPTLLLKCFYCFRIYDNYGNLRPRSRHQSRRGSQVMLRKDILYSGSLYNIPEYK